MSGARKCDACGAYGEYPYPGWLRIETSDSRTRPSMFSLRSEASEVPSVRFDVCSHACLPTLAFEKAEAFAEALA